MTGTISIVQMHLLTTAISRFSRRISKGHIVLRQILKRVWCGSTPVMIQTSGECTPVLGLAPDNEYILNIALIAFPSAE